MNSIEIRIPQLGEGLQEARLLRLLKQPGEEVRDDEPIFEMETDKAVMAIETPAAGRLERWIAHEDDVMPIGAVIGYLRAAERPGGRPAKEAARDGAPPRAEADAAGHAAPAGAGTGLPRAGLVPPRVRAAAHRQGMEDQALAALAARVGRPLTLADVEAPPAPDATAAPAYRDTPLPPAQRTLVFRLQRGTQAVIPATVQASISWDALEEARAEWARRGLEGALRRPARYLLFAWCAAQAAREFPRLRSAFVGDYVVREYAELHLGIAVARPGDELVIARVADASALPLEPFLRAAEEAIGRARAGEDQAGEAMQLSLTNLSAYGIRSAIPVVAAPAAATLFLGAPYDEPLRAGDGTTRFRRVAETVLTFDHRLLNGVGAARYLAAIARHIERMPGLLRADDGPE